MKKINLKTLVESLVREQMKSMVSPVVSLVAALEDAENGTEMAELLVSILRDPSLAKEALGRLEQHLEGLESSEESSEESDSMSAKDFGVGSGLDRATGVRGPR